MGRNARNRQLGAWLRTLRILTHRACTHIQYQNRGHSCYIYLTQKIQAVVQNVRYIMGSLFDTGVRPLVDKYLLDEAAKERNYGSYWSASSAGYCMRKVIFERLGVPKIAQEGDARKQRVFTAGHIFHNWLQEITKNAGISIAQEVELQDEELMIRGHFDDLVLIGYPATLSQEITEGSTTIDMSNKPTDEPVGPPRLILYDYKTVNSRSFMWAKKNGNAMSHFHRLQLGTYMYMIRQEHWQELLDETSDKISFPITTELTEARILKIEKENLMMMEQQLMWDAQLEKDVVSYWRTLNGYWKKKTMPKCTCADFEGGFMAKEAYNGYYFNGEPCSLEYYEQWKAEKHE